MISDPALVEAHLVNVPFLFKQTRSRSQTAVVLIALYKAYLLLNIFSKLLGLVFDFSKTGFNVRCRSIKTLLVLVR